MIFTFKKSGVNERKNIIKLFLIFLHGNQEISNFTLCFISLLHGKMESTFRFLESTNIVSFIHHETFVGKYINEDILNFSRGFFHLFPLRHSQRTLPTFHKHVSHSRRTE